jgi:hypothetical protein
MISVMVSKATDTVPLRRLGEEGIVEVALNCVRDVHVATGLYISV